MTYIDKDKLLNRLCGNDISRMEDYYYNAILDEPEADVVEVVRCKDCRYYDEIYSSCSGVWDIGEYRTADVNGNDYCSYGEPMRVNYQKIADYLLTNSVVVLPCKMGDTVYYPSSSCDKIFEKTIDEILINGKGTYIHFASTYMPLENIGKTVFLTREEAEKALKGAKSYGKVDKCE